MVLEQAPSWAKRLSSEFGKPYMQGLHAFLQKRAQQGIKIFPAENDRFQALELTSLDQVKIVILGQDPYHQPGQAHGLSFSVRPGITVPPSLKNIYKELEADLAIKPVKQGCLKCWANQGVLLLNAVLSVEESRPNSHQGQGWEVLTDCIIDAVNQQPQPVVFMLWGSYAQRKASGIDTNKHLTLKAPHPSPLSAYRGFLGCRHFSQANQFLIANGVSPINWQLPDEL